MIRIKQMLVQGIPTSFGHIIKHAPYNKNKKTCVAKEVLKLISKRFKKGSELGKLFNRSTVKVSYCTTRNIAQHISAHNNKILAEKKNPKPKTCN